MGRVVETCKLKRRRKQSEAAALVSDRARKGLGLPAFTVQKKLLKLIGF